MLLNVRHLFNNVAGFDKTYPTLLEFLEIQSLADRWEINEAR